MNNILNQSIIKATEEILDSVLGWGVKAGAPVEKMINSSSAETSVIISFLGSISGAFTLKCSTKLAGEMASAMLGMEVEAGSEDMKDAVGELLNMIVGAAKTRYSAEGDPFKVSIPTTIMGKDYTVHLKANSSDKISLIDFNCNHDSMSIEVFLK